MEKKCKDNEFYNKKTGRCISKTGTTYKKLMKELVSQKVAIENEDPNCPENKAYNRKSKRCITIGTALYKKALKEGWVKPPSAVPLLVSKRNCKNTHTFVMFDDIQQIPKTDFLQLSNGFCFSAEELISYINDSNFANKNPHDKNIELFTDKEIEKIEHKELKKALQTYFSTKKSEYNNVIQVLHKHSRLLHVIARTGRICYFNQLSSHEKTTSAPFERSIDAINTLMTEIYKLSEDEREVFLKLYDLSPNNSLINVIDNANKGNSCIHGVGINLIKVFIKYFFLIEQKHKINYDFLFTGLYFIQVLRNNSVQLVSADNWFSPDPSKPYFNAFFKNVKWNFKSSLIMNMNDIKKKGKSEMYEDVCINESYLATIESSDNWKDIPEWRKIKHEDNSCFDLFFIIKTITSNLNESKNNNPYPQFPNNPFTRKNLLHQEILNIKRQIDDNYITVSPSLQVFLNTPSLWEKDQNWESNLLRKFERTLRFKRLNTITDVSDVNISGFWVLKNTPVSKNESMILRYLNNFDTTVLPILKRSKKDSVSIDMYYKINQFSSFNKSFVEIKE